MLAGCAGLNLKSGTISPELVGFTVETLAVPIGYYSASNEVLDTSLRNVYDLAIKGQLTAEGVNKIMYLMDTNDPLQLMLIRRGLRLLELAGADIVGEQVLSLAQLDKSLIEAAARGYSDGYDTWMLSHQKESGQA